MSSIHFYRDLESHDLPVSAIFRDTCFSPVPDDWLVIVSDIKNSTAAVGAGHQNDVNLVAAGSLIAALNVAKAKGIEIPFFFGGDGGTVLAPQCLLEEIIAGLHTHNANSTKNFGLPMSVGSMPVRELLDAGHSLKIARLRYCPGFYKPVVIGSGLRFAETCIKNTFPEEQQELAPAAELNMSGLECRWDRVKPPVQDNEIVCYLIEAVHPDAQLSVYREVLDTIDAIYGNPDIRHPLSEDKMKILLSYQKIKQEMMVKFGRWKVDYFAATYVKTFLGRLQFRHRWNTRFFKSREYVAQLIANADTLTIDGRINTIITGNREKRMLLLEYLSALEAQGRLIYGHHISPESVMTCYIENRDPRHIHFVDGSDGGYTEASKELKAKLALLHDNV